MFRNFPIFLMLLAQAIATIAPVGLVRCVAADGRECIEVVGQDCHCSPLQESDEHVDDESDSSSCCRHCSEEDEGGQRAADDEVENRTVSVTANGSDCDCEHSPLHIDQVQDAGQHFESIARSMTLIGFDVACLRVDRTLEQPCLRSIPLRPCRSPHLVVLATTVLRV